MHNLKDIRKDFTGFAIPLLILYELSIFSVKFIENKNLENTDA
jgi:sec-independent protein translocase protein TatC